MDIAVIGGGASGLIAAIAAARQGVNVTVIERLPRLAKKILATGNGRCNISNMNASPENYHGKNPGFIKSAISTFWVEETIEFFEELGVLMKEEEDGKLYPYSMQASSISDVLRTEMSSLGIKTICGFEASDIKKLKDVFKIVSYKGEIIFADKVILAAGGKASPDLGSNGSGYRLAERFGHKVSKLFPALVQIKTSNPAAKSLQGLKVNGKAGFYEYGQFIKEAYGEILFTDYGFSGPPVFELSRLASVSKCGEIKIDLMPEYSKTEVYEMLCERRALDKPIEEFFTGMLAKKLGQILLKSAGAAPLSRRAESLTDRELETAADLIKGWAFEVSGTMSWNNAQVTAGGIEVSGVNPITFESKFLEGLYFAGEILDIDGDCGGYNLQWAWSSGYIAGISAAEVPERKTGR